MARGDLLFRMPQVKLVGELYENGHSVTAIATTMNSSITAVQSALRQLGIKPEPRYWSVQWTLNEIRMRCTIDKNECWIWGGCLKPNGYPHIRSKGKSLYGHRMAFALAGGLIRPGQDVCHICDVRSCCNPEHLFSGTRLSNMRDAQRKGRLSMGVLHGVAVRRGIERARASK